MRTLFFLLLLTSNLRAQTLKDAASTNIKTIAHYRSQVSSETNELEKTLIESVAYNKDGKLIERTLHLKGVRWTTSFDPSGKIKTQATWYQNENQIWERTDSLVWFYDELKNGYTHYPSKAKTVFSYTKNKQLISKVTTLENGNEDERYTCGYDAQKRMLWEETRKNQAWLDSSIWSYKNGLAYKKTTWALPSDEYSIEVYNQEMNLISLKNYKRKNEDPTSFVAQADSLIYKYDKQNKCIKATLYVDLTKQASAYVFDAIMPFERSTRFAYDEKGNVILMQDSAVNSIVPDWHWTIMETKYRYDNNGNVIEEMMTDTPSQLNFRDAYTYNDQGDLIEHNTYTDMGELLVKNEYSYVYHE